MQSEEEICNPGENCCFYVNQF